MRILIDIGHPAHVHLFKNLIWELEKNKHLVVVTVRMKEVNIELIKKYKFHYVYLGKVFTSIYGKLWGLPFFTLKLLFHALKFKPDLLISHGSMYAAHVGWIIRKPHISLEDTGNYEQIKLYAPFSNSILVPSCLNLKHFENKVIYYNSYHELAYLHPSIFIPNQKILEELQVRPDERYVLLRFVSWDASHDFGHKGMSLQNKRILIDELKKHCKIFISSQCTLPSDLEYYRLNLNPEQLHDVIAFASMTVSESATVASEGACLGVPGIYIDNTGRYYTFEQEKKYELIFNFTESDSDQKAAINKAIEIISKNYSRELWIQRRDKMLNEKIKTTDFLFWFIENYPHSAQIMLENPDYQLRFK